MFSQPFQKSEQLQTLTQRESQVLSFLVYGYSYIMPSSEMEVSLDSFGYNIKNIDFKLHAYSKSEAVANAIQNIVWE